MADKNEEKKYKFTGIIVRCIWNSDNFKVFALEVDEKKYPNLKKTKYGNVTISGDLPDLTEGSEYNVVGIEQLTKNGYGYKVINIKQNEPASLNDMYLFLSEILTINQAQVLWENYPDIVQRVKENRFNDIDFSRLKGITENNFEKIKQKIVENFCLADLIIEFQGYFSLSIIKRIYDKYTSIDVLKKKLRQNPYKCLCGLARVGFKTADKMLLDLEKISKNNVENGKLPIIDFEYDLKTSPQRCLACILYLLEENEAEGHTKMNLVDLRSKCMKAVPACAEHFAEVIKDNKDIYYDKSTMNCALQKTFDVERNIAQTIVSVLHYQNDNNKWRCDKEKYKKVDNVELSDEQLQVLTNLCDNPISIINGAAGCVDCDTEYFNGCEWKPISQYTDGEKVLQYNEDGTAELVYPNAYIKNKTDYLWHFKTKNGLNQCLSDNHTCYYETRWGVFKKDKFETIRKIQEQKGFTGRFLTSFNYSGEGINLSDNEIRLMVAVFADGCYINKKENNNVRINVKKQRKIERAIMLLNNMNKKYTINTNTVGYTQITFHVSFYAKHFPKEWYNCTQHQLQIIADEVMYWDGTFSSRERYTTSNKSDADFIQFVFSAVGYKAIIEISDRRGTKNNIGNKEYIRKSLMYTVTRTKINKISMSVETRSNRKFGKTQIERYKTKDGYEYCFNVPSHLLVLRRNNRIFITGNCGKSASTSAIIKMLKDKNKSYRLLAPTGKSAKIISDFTHEKASTIHRGLCYMPNGFYYYQDQWSNKEHYDFFTHFAYNKYNRFDCDVIIVDEFSMVDIYLFQSLIEAIDFTRTKLLLIGDNAQLCSVGCGNLLHDFMNSKLIPTTTLTKVFRYDDGGLMKVATDVRFCKAYLDKSMKGKVTIFGDNKDYTFVDLPSENIPKNVVALYKKLLEQGNKVEDIQVLTAKNIGDCGTTVLNNMIQKIANPNYGKELFLKHGDTTYYIGDFVMQKVNNYKAELDEGYRSDSIDCYNGYDYKPKTAFVANGETGTIVRINNNEMTIDFDGVCVRYTKADLVSLGLAYAISIYKSQGSSINNVIVCTPRSHTFMLNSNIIYVALTRMRKKCYHLGALPTVNQAIAKKANLERHTLMQELLTTVTPQEIKYIKLKDTDNKLAINQMADLNNNDFEDIINDDELPF